jgi:hypothetical protein
MPANRVPEEHALHEAVHDDATPEHAADMMREPR